MSAAQELALVKSSVAVEHFMPVFSIGDALALKEAMHQFIAKILVEGVDYGVIPGTNKEKVLKKPGAEKLCKTFGLSPRFIDEKVIEDWTGAESGGEALFYYRYKCQLYRGELFIAEAIGSCNSRESKYRYRWISDAEAAAMDIPVEGLKTRGGRKKFFEPQFALNARETTGKFGKPESYWDRFDEAIANGTALKAKKALGAKEHSGYELEMDTREYRVPNPDIADVVNTCQKMATKRALVAAVLIGTNASDSFTQDLDEDLPSNGHGHEESAAVAERRVAEEKTKAQAQAQAKTPDVVTERVNALLARTKSPEEAETVLGEVFNAIEGFTTRSHAEAVWAAALKKYGDPEKKPSSLAPVLGCLVIELMKCEDEKAKQQPQAAMFNTEPPLPA